MAGKMSVLREHIETCPFGWWDGKVVVAKSTSDADIIAWLAKLRELAGIGNSPERRKGDPA